jgi:ABC-type enterochelin transport system permease subunit
MDWLREIGKYIVIVTCAIAVLHGIIYRTMFAPLEISIACMVGIVLWVIGFLGMKIQKFMDSRRPRKAGRRPKRAARK